MDNMVIMLQCATPIKSMVNHVNHSVEHTARARRIQQYSAVFSSMHVPFKPREKQPPINDDSRATHTPNQPQGSLPRHRRSTDVLFKSPGKAFVLLLEAVGCAQQDVHGSSDPTLLSLELLLEKRRGLTGACVF